MKDICRIEARLILLCGLSLILAGCPGAGMSGGGLGGKEKLAYSAFYERSDKLRQMPPLHERGIDSLVIMYLPRDKVVFRSFGRVAFVTRASEVDNEVIVPEGFVEGRILSETASAAVKTRLATAEEIKLVAHMTAHLLSGVHTIDETGQAILAKLNRAGVDAVLVAQEPETLPNFLSRGGAVPLPPKGLTYKPGWGAYAFAAVRFFLIDTATSKEVIHSGFTQASAERSTFPWQHFFDLYTPGQQQVIRTMLRDRLANNVRAMLQLVKVIPGDDGAYLTYDPAEGTKWNRAFPE